MAKAAADLALVVAGAQKEVGRRKLTLADLVDERWILPP